MASASKVTIGIGLISAVAGLGLKDIILGAFAYVVLPISAASGVGIALVEIHAANDRHEAEMKDKINPVVIGDVEGEGQTASKIVIKPTAIEISDKDLPPTLDKMIEARQSLLDIYAGNPEGASVIYSTTFKFLLREDAKAFIRTNQEKRRNPAGYTADVAAKDTELRRLHMKLLALNPYGKDANELDSVEADAPSQAARREKTTAGPGIFPVSRRSMIARDP
jgi:hypothetical protein